MKTQLVFVTVCVLVVVWWHLDGAIASPLHALFTEEISTQDNDNENDNGGEASNFLYGIRPHEPFSPHIINKRESQTRRRPVHGDVIKAEQTGKDGGVEIKNSGRDLSASASGYGGGGGGYSPTGYVNYGARTGGYGAFSWYSDHPVGGGYHG